MQVRVSFFSCLVSSYKILLWGHFRLLFCQTVQSICISMSTSSDAAAPTSFTHPLTNLYLNHHGNVLRYLRSQEQDEKKTEEIRDKDVKAYLDTNHMCIPPVEYSYDHCHKGYGYEYMCMTHHAWGCDHCHFTLDCHYCGFMSCENRRAQCGDYSCSGRCGTTHRSDWPICSKCGRTDADLAWNSKGWGCVACGKYKCGHDECV